MRWSARRRGWAPGRGAVRAQRQVAPGRVVPGRVVPGAAPGPGRSRGRGGGRGRSRGRGDGSIVRGAAGPAAEHPSLEATRPHTARSQTVTAVGPVAVPGGLPVRPRCVGRRGADTCFGVARIAGGADGLVEGRAPLQPADESGLAGRRRPRHPGRGQGRGAVRGGRQPGRAADLHSPAEPAAIDHHRHPVRSRAGRRLDRGRGARRHESENEPRHDHQRGDPGGSSARAARWRMSALPSVPSRCPAGATDDDESGSDDQQRDGDRDLRAGSVVDAGGRERRGRLRRSARRADRGCAHRAGADRRGRGGGSTGVLGTTGSVVGSAVGVGVAQVGAAGSVVVGAGGGEGGPARGCPARTPPATEAYCHSPRLPASRPNSRASASPAGVQAIAPTSAGVSAVPASAVAGDLQAADEPRGCGGAVPRARGGEGVDRRGRWSSCCRRGRRRRLLAGEPTGGGGDRPGPRRPTPAASSPSTASAV